MGWWIAWAVWNVVVTAAYFVIEHRRAKHKTDDMFTEGLIARLENIAPGNVLSIIHARGDWVVMQLHDYEVVLARAGMRIREKST